MSKPKAGQNTDIFGGGSIKPEEVPWQKFVYNSDTGEFLGRNAGSWGLILLFYIIYYACLAAFWGVLLLIFFQTLDEAKPRWETDSSIIGTNPGLGYRPMPPDDYIESTLIWFKLGGKASEWKSWSDRVTKFLEPYDKKDKIEGRTITKCKDDQKFAEKDKVCEFDIKELGTEFCTKEQNFGYEIGKPCVLIKLNKIFGWKPELYENKDELPSELIESLPEETVKKINETKQEDDLFFNKVFVTCQGENPADKENLGKIEYFPGPFFKSYYYPYEKGAGYLQPLVAVRFASIETGVLINIECRAYAKNIKHDRSERIGSVHFELLQD